MNRYAERLHAERLGETQAVKAALAKAGIVAKVRHGRGTAAGWLEVHILNTRPCFRHSCPAGIANREQWTKALEIARTALSACVRRMPQPSR